VPPEPADVLGRNPLRTLSSGNQRDGIRRSCRSHF
jgi:hypothetical protein